MDTLLKILLKEGRIKVPEPQRPEEVGKTDNSKYCSYHQMIGHPTKSCYIFRDQIQTLVDTQVVKIHADQKTVMANITTSLHIGQIPVVPTEVELIPAAEQRITNMDPSNQRKNGMSPFLFRMGVTCGSIPTSFMVTIGWRACRPSQKAKIMVKIRGKSKPRPSPHPAIS